jgi:hypothetical protein
MNGRGSWAFVMQTRWARGSLSMGRVAHRIRTPRHDTDCGSLLGQSRARAPHYRPGTRPLRHRRAVLGAGECRPFESCSAQWPLGRASSIGGDCANRGEARGVVATSAALAFCSVENIERNRVGDGSVAGGVRMHSVARQMRGQRPSRPFGIGEHWFEVEHGIIAGFRRA